MKTLNDKDNYKQLAAIHNVGCLQFWHVLYILSGLRKWYQFAVGKLTSGVEQSFDCFNCGSDLFKGLVLLSTYTEGYNEIGRIPFALSCDDSRSQCRTSESRMFLHLFCLFLFLTEVILFQCFRSSWPILACPGVCHQFSLVYGTVFSSLVLYQPSNFMSVSWLVFLKVTVPANY